MKISAPVQAQLVKGAVIAVAVLAGVWAVKRLATAAGGVIADAADTVLALPGQVYDAVPESIKPTSPENIFYKAANLPGQVLTGNDGWTLGGWIYDVTH